MTTKSAVLFLIASFSLVLTASYADPLEISATVRDSASLSIEESPLGPFFADPPGSESLKAFVVNVSTNQKVAVSISLLNAETSSPPTEEGAEQRAVMYRTNGFWSTVDADGVEISGAGPGNLAPIYLIVDAEQVPKNGGAGSVAMVSVIED